MRERSVRRVLVAVCAVLALAIPAVPARVRAQEAPPKPPPAPRVPRPDDPPPVRETAPPAAESDAGSEVVPDSGPAPGPAEVRRLYSSRRSSYAAGIAFERAFARSDWSAYDRETDADLLSEGRFRTGAAALQTGDGELARRAYDALAATASGESAVRARIDGLAIAHALLGDTARALSILDEVIAARRDYLAGFALVHRGDVKALTRDPKGASADWLAAVRYPYEEGAAEGPVNDVRAAAAVRCRFVGTNAPAIPEGEWIGGGPETSETVRGRVAVVLPLEPECRPCRSAFAAVGANRDRWVKDGAAVFALTWPVRRGFLPTRGGNPFHEGERVEDIPVGGHVAHLTEFRTRFHDAPPIGVLPAGKWMYWTGAGRHPVMVVDRAGKIVFAQDASPPFPLVHAFVRRCLAEPAPPPAVDPATPR